VVAVSFDVVLVFMTKKSVEGLLNGKFTIGADASAAAGPVGRNAAAATDARLKAEILSYSRSRGLFAGVSLDGSAIEMDPTAQTAYYGTAPGQPPARVPESALKLVQDLAQATQTAVAEPGGSPAAATTGLPPLPPAGPTPALPSTGSVRQQLGTSAKQLYGLVDQGWRDYLALPRSVFDNGPPPSLESLQKALAKYDRIVQSPRYESLVSRSEFQTTYGLLRDYVEELSSAAAQLTLPPPPGP
jgi:hypothetical protein